MEYLHFSWTDYALFVIMFGLSVSTGIYFGCCGKQETIKDSLHGGKKMPVFPVAASLVASTVSGITLLGTPAEIYMYGTQYWMISLSIVVVGFMIHFTFLPVFYKLELTSVFEYLELRYDKNLRTIFSALFTFNNFIVLPVIIYAPSLAFNQVTGFNIYGIAVIMSLICICYTMMGGVKAVVWADTLQFCITICILAFVLIRGTMSVGGLSVIWEKAKSNERLEFFNMNLDPTVRNTFWAVVVGNIALWMFVSGIHQGSVQRFLAVPTYADCKKVLVFYVVFAVVIKTITCFSGLIVYAKYNDCDPLSAGFIKKPDQILPYFVSDVAWEIPGLSGLFVCGLFTTALSTLSTCLNAVAATLYSDVVCSFVPVNVSERTASAILKVITLTIGLIILSLVFVVERLGTILQLAFSLCGFIGGPLLGLYVMGMLFPVVNKKGAYFGAISSTLIMTVLVTGNQIMTWRGVYKVAPKPLTIYGCNATATRSPAQISSIFSTTELADTIIDVEDKGLWVFNISFHYYTMIGFWITFILGMLVSWITKRQNAPLLNPDLFCPFVWRFIKHPSLCTLCAVEENTHATNTKKCNDLGKHTFDTLLKK